MTFTLDPAVEDPETGLPALPEGWVWKVETFSHTYKYRMSVHVPYRNLIGQKKYRRDPDYWALFDGDTNADVRDAATRAVDRGNDRVSEKQRNSEILGFYPPKRVV